MDKWQEELLKKAKAFEGGKNDNLPSRVNNGHCNRSDRNFIRTISNQTKQNLNNSIKKGGNKMITVEAALSDIDALIKEAEEANEKVAVYLLKSQKVLLKFVSTMRSNQLLTEADKIRITKAKELRKEKKE